ncbi:MAG: hypothetical protein SPK63_03660 [Eubacteriales bacterium]|nr:hypothetical protein [Eubacteriales bacterium]
MKLFFLIFLACLTFYGCSSNTEKTLRKNTAELREYLYEGSVDGVSASLIFGKREKNYIVNGYATELIEFGVVTFDVPEDIEVDETIAKYVVTIGTARYSGDLQKNPFESTLVADIKKSISGVQNVTAKIVAGEFVKEIKLDCVNENWKIKSADVYSLVAKAFKNDFAKMINNNSFAGEVYIKILNDPDENISDYYWYVCVIGRTGGRLSLIVSPKTGEILAVNNLL